MDMGAQMESKKPVIDSEEYYGIKILKNGTWMYNGSPITRHNLVKLFASVLKKDEAGDYWLITPYEKGRIEVEDVPFTAVELKVESSGKSQQLAFRTNLDDWVTAGAEHRIRVDFDAATGEPSPYIMVRDGLEARIARPVYYELVKIAATDEKDKDLYGVWSAGKFFAVGRAKQ
ncbi:MAG: DUF1285 domain-containing protein [Alphaproteobacteria bacterium]